MARHDSIRSPRSTRSFPRLPVPALALAALCACAPSGAAPWRPPTLEAPACGPCTCEGLDGSVAGPDSALPDAPPLDDDASMSSATEPFTLEAASPRVELHAGQEAWLAATLTRAPGHESIVTLSAAGLPPHVTARAGVAPEPGVIAFLLEASDLARPVTDWPFTIEARADGTSSTRRVLLTVLPEREIPEE